MITTVGWRCNNLCVCVCVSQYVCISEVLISENRPGREQDDEQGEDVGEGRLQKKWKRNKKMGDFNQAELAS